MKIHLALILVIIVLLLNKNNNVESMDCINCNKIYKNQDKACVNKFSNTCKNFKQKNPVNCGVVCHNKDALKMEASITTKIYLNGSIYRNLHNVI